MFPETLRLALVIACFLSAGHAPADEPFVIKPPLQRQLESLMLPEVRLADTDMIDALHYLQLKARTSPQNAQQISFVVHLPADFKPRYEIALDLRSVSLWEALEHLCGQAGVEFSIQHQRITIHPSRSLAKAKVTVRTDIPVPPEPAPTRGSAGPLGRPAEKLSTGRNVRRALNGEIQPEKSGSGQHRNLNGWSIADDPTNKTNMNCITRTKCPGDCGCKICGCNKIKLPEKPVIRP